MKKILCLSLLFVFHYLPGQTSHNQGGFISYKHISGLTYEASIVTYTKISNPVDRSSLTIKWGDGNTEVVARTSQDVIEADVKKNVYTKQHTYLSSGIYTISMQDANRSDSILNINNGNSGNVPFYIESELMIPDANDYNNSVQLLNNPILTANLAQVFRFTPTTYDIDGDLLYFDLVSTKDDQGSIVPGLQQVTDIAPGANNQYSFDTHTGSFTWNYPSKIGLYTLTVRISECRNGKMTGSMLVDYQCRVVSLMNSHPAFNIISSTPNDTVAPNDNIQLHFSYQDALVDSIHLEVFSESLVAGNTAAVMVDSSSSNYLEKTVTWTPSGLHARCAPYIITLRASSFVSNEKFSIDKTFAYYVRDVNTSYCDTVCVGFTAVELVQSPPELFVQIAPNPFSTQTTFYLSSNSTVNSYTLSLFNSWGQRVLYIPNIVNDQLEIDRGALPVGVYFYKVESDSNQIMVTGKLIVAD